jgi:hypothetical protein
MRQRQRVEFRRDRLATQDFLFVAHITPAIVVDFETRLTEAA